MLNRKKIQHAEKKLEVHQKWQKIRLQYYFLFDISCDSFQFLEATNPPLFDLVSHDKRASVWSETTLRCDRTNTLLKNTK